MSMLKKKRLYHSRYEVVFKREKIESGENLCNGCIKLRLSNKSRYGSNCFASESLNNYCNILTPLYYRGNYRYIIEKKIGY